MIKKILEVSLIKTLRFNIHYFGIKGLKLPILVSRYTKLSNLKGKVIIANPRSFGIHFGFSGVSIFDEKYQKSIWDNEGNVYFNSFATLGEGTRISNKGELRFGKGFRLTADSYIICYKKIEFGDDSLVSWNCSFMDTDFHKIMDADEHIINNDSPIRIGDRVWIANGVSILKGTHIKDDVVIAAGSLISGKTIDSNVIACSSGKVLKSNIKWIS